MLKKISSSLLFLLLFVVASSALEAKETFSKEELLKVIPSKTRFIVNLSGKWEKSQDEAKWLPARLPESVISDESIVYRRNLRIEKELLNQYSWQLYFMGIDEQVEVYFNSQFVGRYFGGMTPFNVRIPQRMIGSGNNELKLVVSPSEDASHQIKTQNVFAQQSYTGIIRDVLLVGTPHIWVSEIKHRTKIKSTQAKLDMDINISSGDIEKIFSSGFLADSLSTPGSKKMKVSVDVSLKVKGDTSTASALKENRIITIERERTETHKFSMFINSPKLWSPDNPNLYELHVRVSKRDNTIDEYFIDLGLRDIKTSKKGDKNLLLVNGKSLEIKGVSYIEDRMELGATLDPKGMEDDVVMLKTLGANFVRTKYNPPHPYFVALCDKYGLFIMPELPLYEVPDAIIDLDEIKVNMKNTAKRFIAAYDSHPSVIAWNISDGLDESSEAVSSFHKYISAEFKKSSDKLLSKVCLLSNSDINTDNFDFIGVRHGAERYNFDLFKESLAEFNSKIKNKVTYVLYGSSIQPNNHNGYSDPLSIESQAFYIRNTFHIVRESNSIGSVVNTFNDYRLNAPLLLTNNDDIGVCASGLLDQNRKQRLSFNTLQALFNNEKEPLLTAGAYDEETPIIFIIVGIAMGVLLVFLLNRFRRFREYLFRSLLRPYNFYADIRDQRIMSSIQTILLGLLISITAGIFMSSLMYFYKSSIHAEYIYMMLFPWKGFQEQLFRLIWKPELLLAVSSGFFLLLALFMAFVIRIFAFFLRARIFYRDTLTITVWSAVPMLIILPLAIIMIRLLVHTPTINWLLLMIIAAVYLWIVIRILKATSVVYDIASFKVYGFGLVLIFAFMSIILAIYQLSNSIFAYGNYFMDVMMKFGQ